MDRPSVWVPVSLLSDSGLTASAKLLWIAHLLHPDGRPGDLEAATGLARNTILRFLPVVRNFSPASGGARVRLPTALIADRRVGAQARLLFGLLQTLPEFKAGRGWFTYAALGKLLHLNPDTVRRAIADLVGYGWIRTTQANRARPIRYVLGSPVERRAEVETALARRRLKRAGWGGEAIMQEYLSLLIDSDRFTDNARPGFLVNPLTGERLELDRFYPPNLAFEFNGAQHYGETERFTQAEAEAQRLRDLIKAGICLYEGIQLVIIHEEDLSLESMRRRIGQALPLRNGPTPTFRDLAGLEPLIDLLEAESIKYRANAASGRAPNPALPRAKAPPRRATPPTR